MLLATVDTVGLLGLGYYVIEQFKLIRADQAKLAGTMQTLVRRVTDMEKNEQNRSEVVGQIHADLKVAKEKLENYSTSLDDIDQDVMGIFQSLDEEHNITIERASQKVIPSYRTDRRGIGRRPPDVDERRRQQPRSRDFDSRASSVRSTPVIDSTRNDRSVRSDRSGVERQESRAPVPSQGMAEEEDEALIAAVRRQQPTH